MASFSCMNPVRQVFRSPAYKREKGLLSAEEEAALFPEVRFPFSAVTRTHFQELLRPIFGRHIDPFSGVREKTPVASGSDFHPVHIETYLVQRKLGQTEACLKQIRPPHPRRSLLVSRVTP